MLSESEGRSVLKRLFEASGYRITEDFPFREGDVAFNADGWDAEARVGYEYMTHESRDHEDLAPDELVRIGEWIEDGKLYLFIVDETDIVESEDLALAAEAFLLEVARRRGSAG